MPARRRFLPRAARSGGGRGPFGRGSRHGWRNRRCCSAYTKCSTGRGDEVERTKRYQLAERLSEHCDNLLLLTATPITATTTGSRTSFASSTGTCFPSSHRFGEAAGRIRRDVLQLGEDCPWSLRRLKEDLKDLHGRRLFPDRHVHTVRFRLGAQEYAIYKAVTAYINEFLPPSSSVGGLIGRIL